MSRCWPSARQSGCADESGRAVKYVPRKPREGINVSDTHPLAEAGILVVALTVFFAAAALAIVFLVEIVLLFVPPETEARLFAGWAPDVLVDTIASLGFLTHFNAISKGVLDARDILYFLLVIAAFLYANAIVLDLGRGN